MVIYIYIFIYIYYLDLPLTYKILVDVVGMLFCGRPSQNWSFGTTESKIDLIRYIKSQTCKT